MIGSQGTTLLAFQSSSGFWEPYLLYKNGPYPGTKSPPKNFTFCAIVNGCDFGIKPAGKKQFQWAKVKD